MENRISPEIKDQIRKAMLNSWDPIGVSQYDGSKDEYDQYIPGLYKLMSNAASEQQIFNFLWHVEIDLIGIEGDTEKTRKFAIICKNMKISGENMKT